MVQQALGGGEAETMGMELWVLVVEVELESGRVQREFQHLFLPVVDGDLQIVFIRLLGCTVLNWMWIDCGT